MSVYEDILQVALAQGVSPDSVLCTFVFTCMGLSVVLTLVSVFGGRILLRLFRRIRSRRAAH